MQCSIFATTTDCTIFTRNPGAGCYKTPRRPTRLAATFFSGIYKFYQAYGISGTDYGFSESVEMKAQAQRFCERTSHQGWWLTIFALLLACLPVRALTLTPEEQKIANYLVNASGQHRDRSQMHPDDRLIQVARARAMDMAKRNYFDHVNPDGYGPNYLVRQTGYQLPSFWSTSKSANNIESIEAGYMTAEDAWSGWMASSPHKTHLLALDSFYRDQTSYGVGHYYDAKSKYKHYWVVITAPPSPIATLTIATPAANARVTAPSVAVTGSVSGDQVFSSLQYRLEAPASTPGDWQTLPLPSGSGVGKFTASVSGLKPGLNTVRVRTMSSGNVAREMTRSVKLIIVKPLAVAVDGEGSVTAGFLGTTQRELGAPFTIVAVPKPGFIFSQWEGLPDGTDIYRQAQTVVMTEGLALTAHFVPDPYPALAAGYGGVFTDTTPAHASSGALFTKITSGGVFTGALFFSGQRLALRGKFNSQGDAVLTVPRAGLESLTLTLHIDTTGVDQQITGSITDGTVTLSLDAARSPSTTDPAQYHVRIAPSADTATPRGYGYATVIISANGLARVTGMLADGTPIAAASYLTNNAVPVYVPLVGGAGSLAGTITLTNGTAQATLDWHKPVRPGTRFPAAWDTQNAVDGSVYLPPTGTAATLSVTTATLQIDSPELDTLMTLSFNLGTAMRVTYPMQPPAGWRLSINPRIGRFVGAYVNPQGGARVFSGLVDQATSSGYGYALTPGQSAAVSFAP